MKKALLIEPDAILLEQYGHKLADYFEVTRALTAQQALDSLDTGVKFEVIVMDFDLGRNNGVELLHEIRSYDDWIHIPLIMLSSVPKNRLPQSKLARYGVVNLLYKPQTAPGELLIQARRALTS